MNVTPLVDVVLVLLIIFMVITPLLTKQFYVHAPPKEQDKPQPPQPNDDTQVVLRMDKQGALTINGEPITREALPEKLKRIFAARDQDVLFFDAVDDAPYGDAVQVMDEARGAGAITIGILTEPPAP
jgi:biopolymer transport protein ExbD/biopolymer transport protein TolR